MNSTTQQVGRLLGEWFNSKDDRLAETAQLTEGKKFYITLPVTQPFSAGPKTLFNKFCYSLVNYSHEFSKGEFGLWNLSNSVLHSGDTIKVTNVKKDGSIGKKIEFQLESANKLSFLKQDSLVKKTKPELFGIEIVKKHNPLNDLNYQENVDKFIKSELTMIKHRLLDVVVRFGAPGDIRTNNESRHQAQIKFMEFMTLVGLNLPPHGNSNEWSELIENYSINWGLSKDVQDYIVLSNEIFFKSDFFFKFRTSFSLMDIQEVVRFKKQQEEQRFKEFKRELVTFLEKHKHNPYEGTSGR